MVFTLRHGRLNVTTILNRRLIINSLLSRATIFGRRGTIARANKNRSITSRRTNTTPNRLIMLLMSVVLNSKIGNNDKLVRRGGEHIFVRNANRRRTLNLTTKRLRTIRVSVPTRVNLSAHQRKYSFFHRPYLIGAMPRLFLISIIRNLNRVLNRHTKRRTRVLGSHFGRLMMVPTIVLPSVLPIRRGAPPNKIGRTTSRLSRYHLTDTVRTRSNRILTKIRYRTRINSNIFLHAKMTMTRVLRLRLVKRVRPLFRQSTLLGPRKFQRLRRLPSNKSIRTLLTRRNGLLRRTYSPLNGTKNHARMRRRFQRQRTPNRNRPRRVDVNHAITRRRRNRISRINNRMNTLPLFRGNVIRPRDEVMRIDRPLPRTRSTGVLTRLTSLNNITRMVRTPNSLYPLLPITMTPLISVPNKGVTRRDNRNHRSARPKIRPKRRDRVRPRTSRVYRSVHPAFPGDLSKDAIIRANVITLLVRRARNFVRRINVNHTNTFNISTLRRLRPRTTPTGRNRIISMMTRHNRNGRRSNRPTSNARRLTRQYTTFRFTRRHQTSRRFNDNLTYHTSNRRRRRRQRTPSNIPNRQRRMNDILPSVMFKL